MLDATLSLDRSFAIACYHTGAAPFQYSVRHRPAAEGGGLFNLLRAQGLPSMPSKEILSDPLRGEGVLTFDDAQLRGLALASGEHKHPRPILQKEFSLRLGEYLIPWARLLDE